MEDTDNFSDFSSFENVGYSGEQSADNIFVTSFKSKLDFSEVFQTPLKDEEAKRSLVKEFQERNSDYTTTFQLVSQVTNVIAECFNKQESLEVKNESTALHEKLVTSSLFNSLHSRNHDPVKIKNLSFYEWKLENIICSLDVKEGREDFLEILSRRALDEDRVYFSFHAQRGKDLPDNYRRNGYYENGSTIGTAGRETNLTHPKLMTIKSAVYDDDIPLVNGGIQIDAEKSRDEANVSEEYKEDFVNELRLKSIEELRLLKEDLESKVLYLSEQLLNELDSREKNKRDVEVRNDFIASYIRVEGKIKEDKRKRNKYATPKSSNFSIPYINREHGPSSGDLLRITKVLKAIENDDVGVSKLISDYVMNLGDQFDLQTVVQVRTKDGVLPVSGSIR